jgi:hypothetical protein
MKTKINVPSVLILGACLSLALCSGCATTGPKISSHGDSAVGYTNYKTFMMLRPAQMMTFANPAATPALARQVREQVEAAFLGKGLVKSPDAYADLFFHIHGGVAEKLDVEDWGLSYGRFSRGFAGRQELSQYKEGSLFVDVFDAKTRELIWRGSAVAEIDETPSPDKVKAAVEAIVARYPN